MSETVFDSTDKLPQVPSLLAVLRSYWKLLALGALMGIAIGLFIALRKQKTYTSEATLVFPSSVGMSALASFTGGGGTDLPSVPLLQGALAVPQLGSGAGTAKLIVKSRRLQYQVIRALHLEEKWKVPNAKTAAKVFEGGLKVTQGKSGELIVGFTDTSRELAYKITAATVDELRRLTAELRLDPASSNVRFLERKVAETKLRVAAAQQDLAAFQRQYHIIDLNTQAGQLAQRYAELRRDATTASLEATIALRQANMMSGHAKRLIQSAMDPVAGPNSTLSLLYQRVKEAESELALLKYQLTDEHPQVQEKERALRQAQSRLKAEMQRQFTAVQVGSSPALNQAVLQAAGNQARAAGLARALSGLQQEVDKLPRQAATYTQLSGQVQANLRALTLYQEELEKARILTQSRGPTFVELDPAEMPLEPDRGRRSTIVLLWLMMGLSLASIIPIWQWQRRQTEYENYRLLAEARLARQPVQ